MASATLKQPGAGQPSREQRALDPPRSGDPLELKQLVYVTRASVDRMLSPAGMQAIGWRLRRAPDARSAHRILQQDPLQPHAALLDLREGFDMQALAQFGGALSCPNAGWVAGVDAAQLDEAPVRQLIRDYCFDYMTLPCPQSVLNTVIGHAHGMAALACETTAPDPQTGFDGMIGESPAMLSLCRTLRKAALTEAPVFIAGETGTGKELAALAVHRHSTRHGRAFVAINCGAIPHHLVQSELFGYERGAFTGAQQRKLGRIERAAGGTLFLDEIGDLPLESQASLLRFLQEGSIERLGGHEQIRVDVRMISATHHDLEASVANGRFRADLFHRLCVLRLQQPPLRDRGSDIDRIAEHALQRYSQEGRRSLKGFAPCARRALHRHPWPGNVRELINRVRQAVVMAEGRLITGADLHIEGDGQTLPPTLEDVRAQATREAIERALQRNRGRLMDASRELGVSRVTLYRLMLRHDLRDAETASTGCGAA
ncbi:MAG: sigma-54 dependent transcriptional regulator [Pseudomonadota bacterium]|nr:sigma-54 dependent transcriptional regulator [Pseudomonadota bacterium]